MKLKSLLVYIALATGFAIYGPARATDSPPDSRVILEVDGAVEGGRITFTRSDLESLGTAVIRTATPWHDGVQTFEGVPLEALMKRVGATGETVGVVALNRYRTEIPRADFARHGPILALKRNGTPMDVSDKGPLFIIYPFDAKPALKTETYYGRSAWQVRAITVR